MRSGEEPGSSGQLEWGSRFSPMKQRLKRKIASILIICYSDKPPDLPIRRPAPADAYACRGPRLGQAERPAGPLERAPHSLRATGTAGGVPPCVRASRPAVAGPALRRRREGQRRMLRFRGGAARDHD